MRRALADLARQDRAADEDPEPSETETEVAKEDWWHQDWTKVLPPWAMKWKRVTSLTLLTLRSAEGMSLMQQVQKQRKDFYDQQVAAVETRAKPLGVRLMTPCQVQRAEREEARRATRRQTNQGMETTWIRGPEMKDVKDVDLLKAVTCLHSNLKKHGNSAVLWFK